jgi:hypothetical protein
MRNTTFSRAAARCAAALAAAIGVLVLLPGAAAAASVVKLSFSGQSASATFLFIDADGCLRQAATVSAVDGQSKDELTGHTSSSRGQVVLSAFNPCDGTSSFSFGATDLAPDDFTLGPNNSSASLKVTMQVTDLATGQTRPIQVDVTWIATDKGSTTKSTQRYTYPDGTKAVQRLDGVLRQAPATGTILDGTFDWTRGTTSQAGQTNISSTKTGYLTITR